MFQSWVQYRNSHVGASTTWEETEQKFLNMQKAAWEKVKMEGLVETFSTKASDDDSTVVLLNNPSKLANSKLTGDELCFALSYLFKDTVKNTFVVDWRAVKNMGWYDTGMLVSKVSHLKDIGFQAAFDVRTLYVMGSDGMVGLSGKHANIRASMPVDMQNMI